MQRKRRLSASVIIGYFIVFIALWTIRELVIGPICDQIFSEWANVFIGIGLKVLIWLVPSIFFIRYFEQDLWLTLKEMMSNRVKWRGYILIFLGFCLYYLIASYCIFHQITINAGFKMTVLVGVVLFVGLTEEAVFRGWLLNATIKKLGSWPAILLNAVMFLSIHIPIWYYTNILSTPMKALQNAITVFVLSIIFAWTFVKSRNIFVPIILHTSWDFLYLVFLGWI